MRRPPRTWLLLFAAHKLRLLRCSIVGDRSRSRWMRLHGSSAAGAGVARMVPRKLVRCELASLLSVSRVRPAAEGPPGTTGPWAAALPTETLPWLIVLELCSLLPSWQSGGGGAASGPPACPSCPGYVAFTCMCCCASVGRQPGGLPGGVYPSAVAAAPSKKAGVCDRKPPRNCTPAVIAAMPCPPHGPAASPAAAAAVVAAVRCNAALRGVCMALARDVEHSSPPPAAPTRAGDGFRPP
eukprot:365067-Chlamydomonas_euryale.AAC.34